MYEVRLDPPGVTLPQNPPVVTQRRRKEADSKKEIERSTRSDSEGANPSGCDEQR
jgi:hypothetical protein